jgi:hypothetical protein
MLTDVADSGLLEGFLPDVRVSTFLPEAGSNGGTLLLHNCALIRYSLRCPDIANELLYFKLSAGSILGVAGALRELILAG